MPDIRLTKEFTFEMAHALHNYSGKCENIHGHSYHLSVTVKGPVRCDDSHPDNGMVMDFGDLKRLVQEHVIDVYDHTLVLNKADERSRLIGSLQTKLLTVPFQPTSENLILDFVERIRNVLPGNAVLLRVVLRETSTSYAEWCKADNP